MTLEAAALIAITRAAFRVTSFAATARLLARLAPSRRRNAPTGDTVARVRAAVGAASRRLRGSTCLVQALAAEAMLRRRGIASTLHIGVRPPAADTALDAHAWLEAAGAVVVGDQAGLSDYRALVKST